jgi:hypothetical protein
MALYKKVFEILESWSGTDVDSKSSVICDLWLQSNPAIECDQALPALINLLQHDFPTVDLDALRPSDLESDGDLSTVRALAEFLAQAPMKVASISLAIKKGGKKKAVKPKSGHKKSESSKKKEKSKK